MNLTLVLRAQPDTSARVDRKVSSVFRWLKYSIRAVIPGWALSHQAVEALGPMLNVVGAVVENQPSYTIGYNTLAC